MLTHRAASKQAPPTDASEAAETALPEAITADRATAPRRSPARSNDADSEGHTETTLSPTSAVSLVASSFTEEPTSPEQPLAAPLARPEPAGSVAPPETRPPGVLPPAASPPANKNAPGGPRLVASKVGHRQLLTNPSSQAARIRVPLPLQRSGQSFGATVNLCVNGSGQVTKVSILRSAGPALDPQITRALSGWRYRPLLEAGKPTPFCYVLNYQLVAQ